MLKLLLVTKIVYLVFIEIAKEKQHNLVKINNQKKIRRCFYIYMGLTIQ